MTDVKVEQCDREAAGAWCAAQPFPSKQIEGPKIIAGEWDHHSLVQAFARHRQAAEEAQQERDAGIADKRRRILSEQSKAAKERKARTEARDYESMAIEATHIATAIRSQGHE